MDIGYSNIATRLTLVVAGKTATVTNREGVRVLHGIGDNACSRVITKFEKAIL